MKLIFLIILALLPSIIILNIVYNSDSEKEPKKILISLFGLGIISCFVTFLMSEVIVFLFPSMDSDIVLNTKNYFELFKYSFLVVAFVEEFSKWIFNVTVGWNNKYFNELYDAIVYSVFISLGFASFENFLYLLDNGFSIFFIRSILSVPAHAFFGIAMGSYMGLSKYYHYMNKQKLSIKYYILSLFIPILFHGIYDFCIFSDSNILLFIFSVFMVFLYIYAITKIKYFSKNNNILLKRNKKNCASCSSTIDFALCQKCKNKMNF